MEHRHLNHRGYTLAAIDDIVARGRARDWVDLHLTALSDEGVRARIAAVCERFRQDPRKQRYQFWLAKLQPGPSSPPRALDGTVHSSTGATDVRARFQELLADVNSPSPLGCLDGIETSVRQLVRSEPFAPTPALADVLELEAVLILKRNAARDYVDFAGVWDQLGPERGRKALERFDALYPQRSGESALLQLVAQLASPVPSGHARIELGAEWGAARDACRLIAQVLFQQVTVRPHAGFA